MYGVIKQASSFRVVQRKAHAPGLLSGEEKVVNEWLNAAPSAVRRAGRGRGSQKPEMMGQIIDVRWRCSAVEDVC